MYWIYYLPIVFSIVALCHLLHEEELKVVVVVVILRWAYYYYAYGLKGGIGSSSKSAWPDEVNQIDSCFLYRIPRTGVDPQINSCSVKCPHPWYHFDKLHDQPDQEAESST